MNPPMVSHLRGRWYRVWGNLRFPPTCRLPNAFFLPFRATSIHHIVQPDMRALVCHAVVLSGAKNLALDFSADKQQGAMLRGVYPARSERAQHDSDRALETAFNPLRAAVDEGPRWCYK
jgi:hypothetical protein